VHDQSLARTGRPWLYVVHDQFPVGFMSVVVRTTGVEPATLVNASGAVLASVDADVPMFRVRTMNEWISTSMSANRFYAMLTGVFGLLALGLAGVGVYGVLTQAVGERTREIGVRIALGASTERVIAQVVRDGLRPAAAGLGLGLVLAFALTRLLARFLTPMLFAVGPSDVPTYAVGALVMLMLAAAAAFLPARRAARVDPMVALRAD
jgi:putative ABC transport system permease protein